MFANNFHWSLTCFWQTFLGFQSDGLFNMGTLTLKAFNISKRSLYCEKINAKQWNSEGAEIKIVSPQSYTVVEMPAMARKTLGSIPEDICDIAEPVYTSSAQKQTNNESTSVIENSQKSVPKRSREQSYMSETNIITNKRHRVARK